MTKCYRVAPSHPFRALARFIKGNVAPGNKLAVSDPSSLVQQIKWIGGLG